jgi:hypothetical protein
MDTQKTEKTLAHFVDLQFQGRKEDRCMSNDIDCIVYGTKLDTLIEKTNNNTEY